eukprot:CAMPEP_0116031078 /NCGR_PEP_ID=MMETSP0321-20121206/17276_1 /TAXON_ID=163516 /ORGANISM="Leptocylindrus danicus var. danicus, Strain B650" /LENGTH=1055 /DNA_ID=CAMNT_0003506087 /DNA_START=308 /DNA_END=3475 /DNA_ORIENTATION=-
MKRFLISKRQFSTGNSTSCASRRPPFVLGILRETYNKWERRAPLCPSHIEQLLSKYTPEKLKCIIQPSNRRIFSDVEYERAGATVSDDVTSANLLLGVKQVNSDNLLPNKAYAFFSHVIKGQPENMPMLQTILDRNICLFDYECMVDPAPSGRHRRLVTFGKYAGIAGMIDIFQAVGQKLLQNGFSTPFLNSPMCYMYHDLEEAKNGVKQMGRRIAVEGLPPGLEPLVFAFTGKGNVTRGALEIFHLLPHEMITLRQLKELKKQNGGGGCPQHKVYGLIVEQEHMVKLRGSDDDDDSIAAHGANVAHYRSSPFQYEPTFHKMVAPYVNVLVNGIYWDGRYPRLLEKHHVQELFEEDKKSLIAIADVSCDVNGSIEFLEQTTTIENPFFTYNPALTKSIEGVAEDGIAIMGVDILPTELPRESSKHFGDALIPLIDDFLVYCNENDICSLKCAENLPRKLRNACVTTSAGDLTKRFNYIDNLKKQCLREKDLEKIDGSAMFLSLEGHLFDSGLINQVLDVLESHNCIFEIKECCIGCKTNGTPAKSTMLIKVYTSEGHGMLQTICSKIKALAELISSSETTVRSHEESQNFKVKKPPILSDEIASSVKSDKEDIILLLGSGRVAASFAEYMGRKEKRKIIVAGEVNEEVQAVASEAKRGEVVVLNVEHDMPALASLIAKADIVVSLLPAHMHILVAEECIKTKTNLVTASYVSDAMKSLNQRCLESGITILNEVGLDPGMDHMSAMRIIDEIHTNGGEVTSFSSVCGGLPAPEFANNPLLYKFSWSPRGVLNASGNDAIYRKDSSTLHIPGDKLLLEAKPFEGVWSTLNLECLPNRNALAYEDLYGLSYPDELFRGTLRYRGFSNVMNSLNQLGLLEDAKASQSNWTGVIRDLLDERGFSSLQNFISSYSAGDVANAERQSLLFHELGLIDHSTLTHPESIVNSLCDLLTEKYSLASDERDMVLMHTKIVGKYDDELVETYSSSLQLFGDEHMTAMCKTVGYTTAIAAELVLDGKVEAKGVIIPTSSDIYVPTLNALEAEGIKFVETKMTVEQYAA